MVRIFRNPRVVILVLGGLFVTAMNLHARNTADAIRTIEASVDVVWLEKVASSLQAARELNPGVGGDAKDLRTMAYVRLGALGAPESLAAVGRVEAAARKIPMCAAAPTVVYRLSTHPCWHVYDDRGCGIADVSGDRGIAGPEGTRYGILRSGELGAEDFFLTMTSEALHGAWTRPRLISEMPREAGIKSSSLSWADVDVLEFTYLEESPSTSPVAAGRKSLPGGTHKIRISVSGTFRDSDGDGWTDAEEIRLGLHPLKVDSDGDGVSDGADVTPNYVPLEGVEPNDETIVIQKAFFATFGLSGSRYVLFADESSMKVPVWGYAGPVLYGVDAGQWRKEYGTGAVSVHWSASIKGDDAEVCISDYAGRFAASSQTFHLRRINGQWYVIKRELGPVS